MPAQPGSYHAHVSAGPDPFANLHAVVPLRSLEGGKTRLGEALDPEERQTLVAGLLRHTLTVLRDWPALRRVHVVSADPDVQAIASTLGASVVADPETTAGAAAGGSGAALNEALRAGRDAAIAAGATALLLLPADLPLLDDSALEALLEAADAALAAGSGRPLAVLAPADARGGTNALLLAPPDAVEPRFGLNSLERHLRAAAADGVSVQLVVAPGVAFDLDTPDDVDRLDPRRLAALAALGAAVTAG